jgi:hypothetical protein
MDIVDLLKMKQVRVTEIPKWGTYLRKQWENNFTEHLTDEEKKSVYLNGDYGYLWHLFSYNKKEYLVKEHAEKAFNEEPKDSCFLFYQRLDYALFLERSSMLTADDLLNEEDIYVVDKNFNWTYVRTHERCCGPYFSRNRNRRTS